MPPGSGQRHVMLAALYSAGAVERPDDVEYDAYARFMQRSMAMGWMNESGGLWQINDAGSAPPGSSERPAAWYQVDVADESTSGVPLPVLPFLRCAVDSTCRDGSVGLDAVQILLPIGALSHPGVEQEPLACMTSVRWFEPPKAAEASSVGVRVAFSRDEARRDIGPGFFGLAREVDPPGFVVSATPPSRPSIETIPFGGHFWNGPADAPLEFTATLPGWDADALGWFAAFLGDALVRVGVSETVLLTFTVQK